MKTLSLGLAVGLFAVTSSSFAGLVGSGLMPDYFASGYPYAAGPDNVPAFEANFDVHYAVQGRAGISGQTDVQRILNFSRTGPGDTWKESPEKSGSVASALNDWTPFDFTITYTDSKLTFDMAGSVLEYSETVSSFDSVFFFLRGTGNAGVDKEVALTNLMLDGVALPDMSSSSSDGGAFWALYSGLAPSNGFTISGQAQLRGGKDANPAFTVKFMTVPEPSALLGFLTAGAIGMLFIRRRR